MGDETYPSTERESEPFDLLDWRARFVTGAHEFAERNGGIQAHPEVATQVKFINGVINNIENQGGFYVLGNPFRIRSIDTEYGTTRLVESTNPEDILASDYSVIQTCKAYQAANRRIFDLMLREGDCRSPFPHILIRTPANMLGVDQEPLVNSLGWIQDSGPITFEQHWESTNYLRPDGRAGIQIHEMMHQWIQSYYPELYWKKNGLRENPYLDELIAMVAELFDLYRHYSTEDIRASHVGDDVSKYAPDFNFMDGVPTHKLIPDGMLQTYYSQINYQSLAKPMSFENLNGGLTFDSTLYFRRLLPALLAMNMAKLHHDIDLLRQSPIGFSDYELRLKGFNEWNLKTLTANWIVSNGVIYRSIPRNQSFFYYLREWVDSESASESNFWEFISGRNDISSEQANRAYQLAAPLLYYFTFIPHYNPVQEYHELTRKIDQNLNMRRMQNGWTSATDIYREFGEFGESNTLWQAISSPTPERPDLPDLKGFIQERLRNLNIRSRCNPTGLYIPESANDRFQLAISYGTR